ncbi:MAG: hypothetical protein EOP04_22955 [Proteobacteria bacterium]|nr:MAG: hypothetical protein EOP04_22955 [Pseudomonadota bacterium]
MDHHQGLAAGTLVITPEGGKRIENIKAGDLVLSGVGNGFSRHYEVREANSKPYCGPVIRVEVQADYDNYFEKFEFRATPSHICFAYSENDTYGENSVAIFAFEFYNIKTLEIQHVIHSKLGRLTETNIDKAEEIAARIAWLQGGAMVRLFGHINDNMDDAGYRFMSTSDLKVGMLVVTAKEFYLQYAFIKSITAEHYDGLIYTLDVPETRDFAANGVLLHDSHSFLL